jgi:hypothetical protein
MTWHETPKDELIVARRLTATGEWEQYLYKDLKKGDIFKSFIGDQQLHPGTMMPCDDLDRDEVAVATDDPIHNPMTGQGWAVEMISGELSEIMKSIAN